GVQVIEEVAGVQGGGGALDQLVLAWPGRLGLGTAAVAKRPGGGELGLEGHHPTSLSLGTGTRRTRCPTAKLPGGEISSPPPSSVSSSTTRTGASRTARRASAAFR